MKHALMVRRKVRRVRRSREEVGLLLEGYRSSGLTQRAYAERNGLSLSTLSSWVRRYRGDAGDGVQCRHSLVEVKIARERVDSPTSGGARFELDLSDGLRLWIPPDFEGGALQRLLSVIVSVTRC